MPTLTRRDRVAQGANQGGALYLNSARRWPEPAPGVFELFATHPRNSVDPGDLLTRYIRAITTWDGDGTTKLYTGYGSISANVSPCWVVPLNLNGTWDAPTWAFNAYDMVRWVHWSDGQLLIAGGDGPADWLRIRPSVGGAPPVYIDGWCTPSGYTHPLTIVEHDDYVWVCGGAGEGAVWRGKHNTGNDGEFVLKPLVGWFNTCMFSYQGKLWFQEYTDGSPTFLRYWVEATKTWVTTTFDLGRGDCQYIFPWGGVMLMIFNGRLWSFNGTAVTQRYSGTNVTMLTVDADDNVWICTGNNTFRTSSDLVTWKTMATFNGPGSSYGMHVYEDVLYIGDQFSHIWRTQV